MVVCSRRRRLQSRTTRNHRSQFFSRKNVVKLFLGIGYVNRERRPDSGRIKNKKEYSWKDTVLANVGSRDVSEALRSDESTVE